MKTTWDTLTKLYPQHLDRSSTRQGALGGKEENGIPSASQVKVKDFASAFVAVGLAESTFIIEASPKSRGKWYPTNGL